jgi:two-component system LytT family response regulator
VSTSRSGSTVSPDRLRLLVADDERHARALVRRYAEDAPQVEIVGECESGDDLAASVRDLHPDALLLDIRMPGRDVFDVLASAETAGAALPAVIFATAYDTYAVRAFEMNAVDYLVKPYPRERFLAAVARARTRRDGRERDGLARVIRDLGPRPDRLLVPDGRRMVPLAVADIVWIKAEGDYARVHTRTRNYLVSRSLKDLESRLDPATFLRLHRSTIVQTSHIVKVRPAGSARHHLTLDDGTTVIVSRSRARGLKDRIL